MNANGLIINEIAIDDGKLIFTANNSNALYLYENDVCKRIISYPFETNGVPKFSNFVSYCDNIWMIPQMERKLYCFNKSSGILTSYLLPGVQKNDVGYPMCRDALIEGDNLWVLPNSTRIILKINLKTLHVSTINGWPAGISFDDKEKITFRNMSYCNGYIYLFRAGCSHNIRINTDNDKIEMVNIPFGGKYASVINDSIIISPMKEDSLIIMDTNGKVKDEITLPPWIWSRKDLYEYWYIRKHTKYSIVCPYAANALLMIDNNNLEVKTIDLSYGDYTPKTIWDVAEDDNGFYVFSQQQPYLLYAGFDGINRRIKINKKMDGMTYDENGIIFESGEDGLMEFLGQLNKVKNRNNYKKNFEQSDYLVAISTYEMCY